ncbi:bacteriohemerythrin [Ferrovum myxofaciens]|uniref:bacteriohemerythrin n=1 Tax=Ferrovum myxofaciens TaxID=416213 RepID=UPI00235688A2|nr:hemerythrin family protein [Ferrovum myxofaciens]MBU6995717.1 hemerythrin family protein [Ferrovum myxofaciens]
MYIHWDKSYEIGNPLIDTEHRLLIMLFRKLDVAIKSAEPEATIMRILLEVKKFADFHFTSEENLMHEVGYPDTAAHEEIHSALLAQLEVMIGRVSKKREMPDDLLYFPNEWILQHIAQEDQKIADFARFSEHRPIGEFTYPEYI